MTESQWKIVCEFVRRGLAQNDPFVVASHVLRRECELPKDYYPDFVRFASDCNKTKDFEIVMGDTVREWTHEPADFRFCSVHE